MLKRFLSFAALCGLSVAAYAADKPLVIESGQVKQIPSATALQLQAPTTANASINLPHGTAPTSPTDGDLWTTTSGLYGRINGSTVGPLGAGVSSVGSGNVVGNSTGSTAAPADTTLTSLIDRAFGSTQGQILYRGSSAWAALGTGTAGQVLQTGGASANPSWVTPSGSGGGSSYTVPAVASFAWVNQSTSTSLQKTSSGPILMTTPSTTLNWRLLKIAIPSTPYRVRALLRGTATTEAATTAWTKGLYFYDGTKLAGVESCVGCNGTGSSRLRVQKITNVTTDNTTVTSNDYWGAATIRNELFWAQLRDDGTTLYFDFSLDGDNWINITSFSRASYITPTNIGWGGAGSNSGIYVDLLAWVVDSSASLN
jgi:hypothetical protein